MSTDNLLDSIRENLNGRPGQPIVLGVCSTLAKRHGQEVWIYRAIAIVLGVFFTFATLVAYFLTGLLMKETEDRTRGLCKGICIWVKEAFDKLSTAAGDLFGGTSHRNGTS